MIGKIGTVMNIAESGDLKIRYPENVIYTLCPEAVVKVSTKWTADICVLYMYTCTLYM